MADFHKKIVERVKPQHRKKTHTIYMSIQTIAALYALADVMEDTNANKLAAAILEEGIAQLEREMGI